MTLQADPDIYKMTHFPTSALSLLQLERLVWIKTKYLTKADILRLQDETGQTLALEKELNSSDGWRIKWLYNSVPDLDTWEEFPDNQRFVASYRISPAFGGNGRIVCLSVTQ